MRAASSDFDHGSAPPASCIGPIRADRRNGKKKKRNHLVARAKDGAAAEDASNIELARERARIRIEHAMRVDARDQDEALVARLVEAKRRQQIAKERVERSERIADPPVRTAAPPRLPKSAAARSLDVVQRCKRCTRKEDSLRLVAEAREERRAREEAEAAQLAKQMQALETADAILYGD